MLYNLLRLFLSPFTANTLSVAVSITFSFWANRRFTFERRGCERLARQFTAFCVMFVATLLLPNAALVALFELRPDPARWLENAALITSSVALVGVRYLIIRRIFGRQASPQSSAGGRL